MTKVTRPLFGDAASGTLANIGTFRMGQHGPEFIRLPRTGKPATPAQTRIRACFSAARAQWLTLPILWKIVDHKKIYYRDPPWPAYWRQWLIDHPDCTTP